MNYRGQRSGVIDPPEDDEAKKGAGEPTPPVEHLFRLAGNRVGKSKLKKKTILHLGLDPIELSDEEIEILIHPPEQGNRQDAIESAHAQIRGLEIDRRMYPWNSQAIRLEEFHQEVLPLLQRVQRDPSQHIKHLTMAAAIAIAAETGRSLDQVQQLRVDESSEFTYRQPIGSERCGNWTWDAVSPRYRRDLTGAAKDLTAMRKLAVERAEHLEYRASEMVTDLIAGILKFGKLGKYNLLFPFRGFAEQIRNWLRTGGVDSRITLHRISRLPWDLLHRTTAGELASVCLTLGVAHPLAQVELFYAVLHEAEAVSIFSGLQAMLWGGTPPVPPRYAIVPPKGARFTGCRAFPRLGAIRKLISRFRMHSEEFFKMPLATFSADLHRDRLNGAVMYLLWHQFFCFGTRAICDAYQRRQDLSEVTRIGILSDKDFSSGYKTRVVVATDALLRHMKALEGRLTELQKTSKRYKRSDIGPVWLLDSRDIRVQPKPTNIEKLLRSPEYNFPFPVNTPRRVMRYLLRRSGMKHAHAEAYMGHWWHAREPFSPFSTFEFGGLVADLDGRMQKILRRTLGFTSSFGEPKP